MSVVALSPSSGYAHFPITVARNQSLDMQNTVRGK